MLWKYWRSCTGVGCTPNPGSCFNASAWASSSARRKATWWTAPAPSRAGHPAPVEHADAAGGGAVAAHVADATGVPGIAVAGEAEGLGQEAAGRPGPEAPDRHRLQAPDAVVCQALVLGGDVGLGDLQVGPVGVLEAEAAVVLLHPHAGV